MKKVFGFKEQLAVGDKGESLFKEYYKDLNPRKSEDRAFDFIINENDSLELKSDSYLMDNTENFFFELYSDIEKGKVGGPWRAKKDGVKYLVYSFVNNKTFFWFEVKNLFPQLDEIVLKNNYKIKNINNRGYTTSGYCVPRIHLQHLVYKTDIFN